MAAGIRLKFLERNDVAAVYVTNIDTTPSGPFQGPLMVTMRAFDRPDAIRAVQITSRFPNVHGAPVHIGNPASIGIDLSRRYQNVGDPEVADDELPVFWACGLTPQLAVRNAKPPTLHHPRTVLDADHGLAQRCACRSVTHDAQSHELAVVRKPARHAHASLPLRGP